MAVSILEVALVINETRVERDTTVIPRAPLIRSIDRETEKGRCFLNQDFSQVLESQDSFHGHKLMQRFYVQSDKPCSCIKAVSIFNRCPQSSNQSCTEVKLHQARVVKSLTKGSTEYGG